MPLWFLSMVVASGLLPSRSALAAEPGLATSIGALLAGGVQVLMWVAIVVGVLLAVRLFARR